MQGTAGLLNVLTIPPGATITSPRLVLDGLRGAIFVYTSGGPTGSLIGSWAGTAGTDPYGNAYPAGINVVAGTISGVTFTGTHFILNSSGFFFYSGVPALGNLATSIAPTAGTDAFGNVYPAGVGILQNGLVLFNQASPPANVVGASQVYSDINGRLRYDTALGVDLVLDRSRLSLTHNTMTTQTIPQQMSQPLTYIANEALVESEYEVEIDGTFTTPAGTTATFTFDFFLDGASFSAGNGVTIGTVITQTGLTYAFHVAFRASIESIGVGGTCTVSMDGNATRKGVNVGNAQQFTTLDNVTVNNTINTTVGHTMAIYCNWSATVGTGHSAITYRTKLTRRN